MEAELLAAQIAATTRREPNVLSRSPREVAAALAEGRVALRLDAAGLAGFLIRHPVGGAHEMGTGWVRPDRRGQGLFLAMHRDLMDPLPAGALVFGFPGSPTVRRAMQALGFERWPYVRLPPRVWLALVRERLDREKLASQWRSLRAGTVRTSRELWALRIPAGEPGPKPHDGQQGGQR